MEVYETGIQSSLWPLYLYNLFRDQVEIPLLFKKMHLRDGKVERFYASKHEDKKCMK